MHCKECGLEIPENSRYCPNCGVDQLDEGKNISKNSKAVDGAKKVFNNSILDPVKDVGEKIVQIVVQEVADAIETKAKEKVKEKLIDIGLEKDPTIKGKIKRAIKRNKSK